jgi:hypothetical protein
VVSFFVVGSALLGVAAVAVFGSVLLDAADAWRSMRRAPTLLDSPGPAPSAADTIVAVAARVRASVRARRWSALAVTTAIVAMGLGAVVWPFRPVPTGPGRSPRVTPLPFAPQPAIDVTGLRGAPGSRPSSVRDDAGAGCPTFAAYRDAAVAAQRQAIAPPGRDDGERRAYAAALERMRTSFPALGAELDVWDRVQQQWVHQMQHQQPGWPAAFDSAALDDPAFTRAITSIERTIWRECGAGGAGVSGPPRSTSPNPRPLPTAPR